jgi:3-hydroxybutyryl-CoA dehydrogenase
MIFIEGEFMTIKTIAVMGAGTMGSGIAALCLMSGYSVNVYDPFEPSLEKAKARCLKRTDEATVSSRLKLSSDVEATAKDADYVIEAVPEKIGLKRELFAKLDAVTKPHTILATNTSELSVTAIAGATKRPEKVIGMHWFNPPERMSLIEIVRAVQTSDETLKVTEEISKQCGKTTVVVKDSQGFVTTRALSSLLLEAMRMLEEGVASPQDIDTAIKLGLNHPMGPLELADYVGLDTMLFISDSMTEAMGERFRAPQTLRKLVEAGRLGRKTGQGFYIYEDKK